MSKSFNLSYQVNVTLTVEELWPEGDAPKNPTVADVEALVEREGGWARVLNFWNLVEKAEASVREVTPYVPRSQRTKCKP